MLSPSAFLAAVFLAAVFLAAVFLAVVFFAAVFSAAVLDAVFLAVLVSGFGFHLRTLVYLPLIMVIQYLLCLGVAFIVSAITVYFRDMEQIMGVVMMAWIYVTPVMYNMDYVPEKYRSLIVLNPMTPIVEVYHQILYYRITPTPNYLILATGVSVAVFVIGFVVFGLLDRNFAEEL